LQGSVAAFETELALVHGSKVAGVMRGPMPRSYDTWNTVFTLQMLSQADIKKIEALITKIESQVEQLENKVKSGGATNVPSKASGGSGRPESSAVSVKEYERLLDDYLPKLVSLSKQIGPDVAEQIDLFQKGLNIVRDIIARAAETRGKPADFATWIIPLEELTQRINDIKEKNRASKNFNHLSVVAEGTGAAFFWLKAEPTPAPFVDDMRPSAEFYANRILKDFKGQEANKYHIEWANLFIGYLKALPAYIKQWHTTGLTFKK